MTLVEEARAAERVLTDKTDVEIRVLIDAAIGDMRRVGIREALLSEEDMAPLAHYAVLMFVKANYGHDDSEHDKWQQRYRWAVTALMNSKANECAEEESAADDTDPGDATDTDEPADPADPEGGDEP